MSVIAHVDHSKTTLTNSFVLKTESSLPKQLEERATPTPAPMKPSILSPFLKRNGISMFFEYDMNAGVAAGLTKEETEANDAAMAAAQDSARINVQIQRRLIVATIQLTIAIATQILLPPMHQMTILRTITTHHPHP